MRLSAPLLGSTLLVLALAWAPPSPGESAAPGSPDTAEGVLSFAQALRREGETFRAVTEYLRFLHHYPGHPRAADALEGLGRAYAQAGRWAEAQGTFGRLAQLRPGEASRHLLGAALYRGERYREAAAVLLDPAGEDPANLLGTLALLRSGETSRPGAREDLLEGFAALPRKKPWLGGTLAAVLPGAGHLYADRPRDAAVSFLLNGAFLWGTYESVRREQWALAGILGFLELGWYSGNVVSAVNAAHKWNRREEGRFLRSWEAAALPRWELAAAPSGAELRVTWTW